MSASAFAKIKTVHGVLAALASTCALQAGADIVRCTAPDGEVTYQQSACPASSAARVIEVPSTYPNADPLERQRLFEREAALDRRLEAQREREAREEIARGAQQAAGQAQAPEPPQVLWLPPLAHAPRFARSRRGPGLPQDRRG